MRRPEGVVRGAEALVLRLGAEVGEIALHHHGVGSERTQLGDHRRGSSPRGTARSPGSDREDRAELLAVAEPAALDLAEVHVVHGSDRREQPTRRAGERADLGREQLARRRRRRPRAGTVVSGSRPVIRATWYGPVVVTSCGPTRVVDRLVGDGHERHRHLVGRDGEELGVPDRGHARARRTMRPDSRQSPRETPTRRADRRDASSQRERSTRSRRARRTRRLERRDRRDDRRDLLRRRVGRDRPQHRRPRLRCTQSGTFPCLRCGSFSFLVRSMLSDSTSTFRVSRGSITSST